MANHKVNVFAQGNWRSRLFDLFKIALAILLVIVILTNIQLSDLIAVWEQISLPWLFVNILIYFIAVFIIAYRYWILIARVIDFSKTMNAVIVQIVIGNLVSTGVGAVSYVSILRGRYQIRVSSGVVSILLARFCDLVAVAVGLAISSWVLWPQITVLHWLVGFIISVILGVIIFVTLIFVLRQRLIRLIDNGLSLFHLDRIGLVRRVMDSLTVWAAQDRTEIRPFIVPVVISTLLLYVAMYLYAYSGLRMFAVPVGTWSVVFVFSLLQMLTIVPIQVFGGLGLQDVTNIYLYELLGLSQAQIAPAIIMSRVFFYLANLLLLVYLSLYGRFNSVFKR
jgi:uncharacterized protein (TIRG00374 family)